MPRISHFSSHGLGRARTEQITVPSENHHKVAADDTKLQAKIASLGLVRVAGNVYECKSNRDFWKVQGGRVMRLSSNEVDNGESLIAAPSDTPAAFLEQILGDLTF